MRPTAKQSAAAADCIGPQNIIPPYPADPLACRSSFFSPFPFFPTRRRRSSPAVAAPHPRALGYPAPLASFKPSSVSIASPLMATAPFAALRKPHDLAATLSPAGAAGNDRLSASLRSFPLFSIPSRTVLYLLPFRILLLLLLREPGHSSANLFRVCVLLISVAARYTGYVAFVVVLAAGHFIVVALGATQLRPDAVSLARYSPSLPTASLASRLCAIPLFSSAVSTRWYRRVVISSSAGHRCTTRMCARARKIDT